MIKNIIKRKGQILFKEKKQMKNLMNILKIKDQIQIIENKKELIDKSAKKT